MPKPRPPMPIPFGWFVISYSDELAIGQSRAVQYFGKELVLFRTESGKPVLLDAYCPHLGAHLGYGINESSGQGGRIEGETIVCPFHAWKFNAEGYCTEVPYARNMPPKIQGKQCLQTYPVVEDNQVIYAWYHPDNAAPLWETESFPEANSDDWAPLQRFEWVIKTACQEMAENGADSAHFRYVHQTATFPETELTYEKHYSMGIQRADLETPKGMVKGSITSRGIGPGQGFTRFEGIADTFLMGNVTPIDDETVHVRFAFTQPKVNGEVKAGGVNAAIIRDICKQLDEDKPIWEHKIFRAQPVLCDSDGPIARFRKWYSQFYTEPLATG
ncbi:Rieske 2Fe-2S domain-containing protein [Haliea sp. E1-2-M8]|uniref:aromatic ring-hydroxylating oxygenase subunit alpha n=1 Tax=Haliea sp. E1-2-M8 TaxID=3064706 RepID=UPI00271E8A43|nr:Rieske 2Fe-2S domain-containing protein [Haliea sp. E1-2-M8]MDO8863047.1 Rieske 2Fe-2S domain-containing protein [Haliea sp. E1-2-M8]